MFLIPPMRNKELKLTISLTFKLARTLYELAHMFKLAHTTANVFLVRQIYCCVDIVLNFLVKTHKCTNTTIASTAKPQNNNSSKQKQKKLR